MPWNRSLRQETSLERWQRRQAARPVPRHSGLSRAISTRSRNSSRRRIRRCLAGYGRLRKNGLHPLSINIGAAPNSRSSSLRSTAHSGLRARRTGALAAPRKGEVNAWDNEDFVRTVRQTGRKTLIMAGVWTSVCVMFPAVDAKAAGFKVYAVMDASGDPSEMTSRTTLARFAQAGVIPTSTNAVLSETHRTWNRPEAAELAKLYALVAPNYAAVIESYQKAQDVAKQSTGSATK